MRIKLSVNGAGIKETIRSGTMIAVALADKIDIGCSNPCYSRPQSSQEQKSVLKITTMNGRRSKAMQKLFLVALIVSVCTPAIMAQEPAKAGISNIPSNLRFETFETSKTAIKSIPSNSRGGIGVAGGRAQCPPRCTRGRDRTKVEIYGGYSFLLFDSFRTVDADINDILRTRVHLHGADLSATFNFSRYVGGQFDFSIHKRKEDFLIDGLGAEAEANIQNYLFGVQFKDNAEDGPTLRPFGHLLVGVSRQKLELDSLRLVPVFGDDEFTFKRNSFAMAMGGGIDVNLTDNFSLRAIKLDYLPVFVNEFVNQGVVFSGHTQHNFRAGAGVLFRF
jgi:opacity protein-like surface antigen